jgi:hypothetical protein
MIMEVRGANAAARDGFNHCTKWFAPLSRKNFFP